MLGRTVSAGEGGEAGRLGAGGSRHGAVSSRSGAGPPPRSAAAPAAEDPQSAAKLKPACPEGSLHLHNHQNFFKRVPVARTRKNHDGREASGLVR